MEALRAAPRSSAPRRPAQTCAPRREPPEHAGILRRMPSPFSFDSRPAYPSGQLHRHQGTPEPLSLPTTPSPIVSSHPGSGEVCWMHKTLTASGCGLVMFAIASMLSLAQTASAQSRPSPAVEFAAGAFLFPDDALVTERLFGGSGRIYLSPRISIGPEVAFGDGMNRRHLMLTGNITFDLLPPSQGSPRRITPFVVIGAGLFRTTEYSPAAQTSARAKEPLLPAAASAASSPGVFTSAARFASAGKLTSA